MERMVDVGEVELCVEEVGDPAAPPVLLVHGAAASMDAWDPRWCRRLADAGLRVVRYDHRDTGRSTTRPGPPAYDGGALERDCVGLVEALGLAPVHLVGLSMGGGIAQSIACRRPELVAGLVLMSTSAAGGVDWSTLPGPEPRLQERFADPPPEPDWADREAAVDWLVEGERAFAGAIPLDEARVRELAASAYDRAVDPAAAQHHWAVVGADGDDDDEPLDVRRIAAPTLVVHGTHDPLFPLPHGEALAAAVPGARLLTVAGMGHQVPPPSTWDVVVPAIAGLVRGR